MMSMEHVSQRYLRSDRTAGCAEVSSALGRCRVQKQHLYIKKYNSGPNLTTSTSLTFFTVIVVAFSGALAEELMAMCRYVTTELYIIMDILP